MNTRICLILSIAAAVLGALAMPAKGQTYFGDAATIGDGWVRTYVEYNSGAPARIGIQMNQAAFSAYGSMDELATILNLPSQAPAPFNHVMLDWNPGGHPGPGYNVPHFDFHFYFTSPESVAAIPFSPAPSPVDAAYVASGYIPDLVVVPGMGHHFLDALAPEFNGGEFTKTFLYGYYEGHLTFLEPMITYAYLAQQNNVTADVRQPTNFEMGGYYPSEYGVGYQDGIYNVFLGNLNLAPASPVPEPSTWGALGGLTLIGLVASRRLRQRRPAALRSGAI